MLDFTARFCELYSSHNDEKENVFHVILFLSEKRFCVLDGVRYSYFEQ